MQCVMLLSQIKVNSMAIVRMKSLVVNEKVKQSGMLSSAGDALTSNVEQVLHYSQLSLLLFFFSRNFI